MSVEIKYSDIAPGAKQAFTPTVTDKLDFIDTDQLQQDELHFENYGTICELNQTILDGSQDILPDNLTNVALGLWSNSLSNDDGLFDIPITLTAISEGNYSSMGITFVFDTDVGCWANDINIKWYRDDMLLSEMRFYPDSARYFCQNRVENYNKIEVVFYGINMPYCRLKLRSLEYGVIRYFTGDELQGGSILQELHPISEDISINTLDFNIVSESNFDYMFQKKQKLELKKNQHLKGMFFIDESERLSQKEWDIKAVDWIGVLAKTQYSGGIYQDENAFGLLTDIFATANVPFIMSDTLKNKTVTGHLPISNCREALMQVAFAIGAVVNTSNRINVEVFELSETTVKHFDNSQIAGQPKIKSDDVLTELWLTEYYYAKKLTTSELYNAEEEGTGTNIEVVLSQPHYNFKITNGTIINENANQVIINANEGCILEGRKYEQSTKIVKIKNPIINANDLQNIIKIDGKTLISKSNSQEIAQKCYDYYLNNHSVEANLWITDQKPGDKISLDTGYQDNYTGCIETITYPLRGNIIMAEAVVK